MSNIEEFPKKRSNMFLIMSHYSCTCLLGLCGNVVSIIVLRSDRERKEALFLLQMLAAADLMYLLISLFRYPFKYLLTDKNVYVNMQVGPTLREDNSVLEYVNMPISSLHCNDLFMLP